MGAPIEAILGVMVGQGANELRVGTGRAPRILRDGAPKRLTMRETSDSELRHLMGELLSSERDEQLRAGKRVEMAYDGGSLGAYHVVIAPRAGEEGFDAVFVLTRAREPAKAAPVLAPTPGGGVSPVPALAPALTPTPTPAPSPALAPAHTPTLSPDLANLLAHAAAMRASDVHVRAGEPAHVRVDGRLRPLTDDAAVDTEQLLAGCLDAAALARLASGASVDLAIDVPDAGRFRVNVYRTGEGLAAAFRLLAGAAPALSSLKLPVALDDIVDLPHGLVILCGPTGSGKTTTLAALAAEALRRRSVALITLEDPIEYVLRGASQSGSLVRQRQIGRDVRDFATGLRDALREDPDVLVVGEMRDAESINLALTAAETGHLVLTSLHSRSTASAVERIVDTYPPERQVQVRVQLADALQVVVAQRLLPRARGSGRVVALEVLRVTHAVATAIREGKTAQIPGMVQSSRREGMIPLERCLADLVQNGTIALDAARAVANEPVSLESYLAKRVE
jgi:twitching motility protein PilT